MSSSERREQQLGGEVSEFYMVVRRVFELMWGSKMLPMVGCLGSLALGPRQLPTENEESGLSETHIMRFLRNAEFNFLFTRYKSGLSWP